MTNAEFPVVWPSPFPMTTTLYTGGDQPRSSPCHRSLPPLTYRHGRLPQLSEGRHSGQNLAFR